MIYQECPPLDRLEQGDVLKKTADLDQLLATYHPYYAQHADNKFFVVLTQSCDLVQRAGGCKARYISLAPVRPLKAVLRREFEGKLENVEPGGQPFGPHRIRSSLEQFLQRLFNNNEAPFFYYEAAHESGIYEEMCAILALPISLKPEHYEKLRAAKIAGIRDVFQAKLGWLFGQMYSRVGTPDFEVAVLTEKVKAYTEGIAVWVEEPDAKTLKRLVQQHKGQPGNGVVGARELAGMIKQLPKRKAQVVDTAAKAASAQGLFGGDAAKERDFRRALDRDFAPFFR